eukprot:scaffold84717_cov59-Phaeocystis_antarctica.AAC.2
MASMSLVGKRTAALTILVGAATTALLTLWRRHRRWQLQQRLLASAEAEAPTVTDTRSTTTAASTTTTNTEANTRPIDSCRVWGLTELAALHYSADYIFVYKQYDLHMDHAIVPVTLATQVTLATHPRHTPSPHTLATDHTPHIRHAHATLATQMMEGYPALADAKTAFGFRHVHQLDFATSGVLCIALNKKAAGVAGKLFENRTVSKRYLALVEGHPTWEHMRVERGVGEDGSDSRGFRMALEGQPGCTKPLPAMTDCYVVDRGTLHGKRVTKLLLCPQSGRRHQLRLHCLALGHPVVGDVAYTGDRTSPRMMLHAWMLRLPLPKTRAKPDQAPICIASFDPYPAASAAASAAASSGAWGRRGAGGEVAPAVREVAAMEP